MKKIKKMRELENKIMKVERGSFGRVKEDLLIDVERCVKNISWLGEENPTFTTITIAWRTSYITLKKSEELVITFLVV